MLLITFLSFTGCALAYTETQAKFLFYKNIDPIKFPGSYDRSHQHIFFGSDAISATTTTSAELRKGCVTEDNTNDFSTYWTPTLLYTGGASPTPIIPARFNAYYENAQNAEIPFPENLKMVVGNADAKTESQMIPGARASWYCDGPTVANGPKIDGFPAVTCPSYLHHLLWFPDCVNPTTLEVSYSSGSYGNANYCPTGQKRIVRLRFSIRYTLHGIVPAWTGKAPLDISSSNKTGTTWSSHGDFINGWDPLAAKNMMNAPGRTFKYIAGSISDGSHNSLTCKPTDKNPTLGTSDYETAYKLATGAAGAVPAAPAAPASSAAVAPVAAASASKAAPAAPVASSSAAAPVAPSSKAAMSAVASSKAVAPVATGSMMTMVMGGSTMTMVMPASTMITKVAPASKPASKPATAAAAAPTGYSGY